VCPKFIFIRATLAVINPGQSEHHIEEINLPCIQGHDIIVALNDVGVEVVLQVNSSATEVI
jgi:hypothetical protein